MPLAAPVMTATLPANLWQLEDEVEKPRNKVPAALLLSLLHPQPQGDNKDQIAKLACSSMNQNYQKQKLTINQHEEAILDRGDT
jgi:hypothetical protein